MHNNICHLEEKKNAIKISNFSFFPPSCKIHLEKKIAPFSKECASLPLKYVDPKETQLSAEEEGAILDLIKREKYYDSIKYRLKILNSKHLTRINRNTLSKLFTIYHKAGLLTKNQRRKLEKNYLFVETITLPPLFLNPQNSASLEFHGSKLLIDKFQKLESRNKNEIYHLFQKDETSKVIKKYTQMFKVTGFFKSRKNLKNFLAVLIVLKKNQLLNQREYSNLRKTAINAKPIHTPSKMELDHFPPDDLYRFAKDPHIRALSLSKKPIWQIPRGKHRRAISTGFSYEAAKFRISQRKLFAKGLYCCAIENYLKRYIDDKIITKDNLPSIMKPLQQCVKVNLINLNEFKRCQILLGLKGDENISY